MFERAFTETRADRRTAEVVFEQILPLRETCEGRQKVKKTFKLSDCPRASENRARHDQHRPQFEAKVVSQGQSSWKSARLRKQRDMHTRFG